MFSPAKTFLDLPRESTSEGPRYRYRPTVACVFINAVYPFWQKEERAALARRRAGGDCGCVGFGQVRLFPPPL